MKFPSSKYSGGFHNHCLERERIQRLVLEKQPQIAGWVA
jgi:hypothetical protein